MIKQLSQTFAIRYLCPFHNMHSMLLLVNSIGPSFGSHWRFFLIAAIVSLSDVCDFMTTVKFNSHPQCLLSLTDYTILLNTLYMRESQWGALDGMTCLTIPFSTICRFLTLFWNVDIIQCNVACIWHLKHIIDLKMNASFLWCGIKCMG